MNYYKRIKCGAYALCDLEEHFFRHCDWIVASKNHKIEALLLIFKVSDIPYASFFGSNFGIRTILEKRITPAEMYVNMTFHQYEEVKDFYSFSKLDVMQRMKLDKKAFKLFPGAVTKLSMEDLINIKKLYNLWPNNFFVPHMLKFGVYYGAFYQGRLVSVAGTHAVSLKQGIACIGNIFTHPEYRGRGFAKACTSAVISELLTKCSTIVLDVEEANFPALKLYKTLGFRFHSTFLHGMARRKIECK